MMLVNFNRVMWIWLFFWLLLPVSVLASESVPQYEVTIYPNEDSTFTVEEIIYYDFGRTYKHGITRNIPLQHPQDSTSFFKKRYLEVDLQSVLMDGKSVLYEVVEDNDSFFLKIGDPNQTFTSEHKYTISYNVRGGLQYFDDGNTELYWDAVGTEWLAPIDKVIVHVADEYGLLAGVSSCYVGALGESESCGEVAVDGNTHTYVIESIGLGRGVTIVFAMRDTVPTVILEEYNVWYFVVPGALIFLFAVVIGLYRYRTEFKTGRFYCDAV